jgi:hypothetical protein
VVAEHRQSCLGELDRRRSTRNAAAQTILNGKGAGSHRGTQCPLSAGTEIGHDRNADTPLPSL